MNDMFYRIGVVINNTHKNAPSLPALVVASSSHHSLSKSNSYLLQLSGLNFEQEIKNDLDFGRPCVHDIEALGRGNTGLFCVVKLNINRFSIKISLRHS